MKAVCIHCGKSKSGAWTMCGACRQTPDGSVDMAQSVLLSDHNLLTNDLSSLAAQIASGEGVKFSANDVERIARDIERTRTGRTWRIESLVVVVGALFLIAAIMAVIIRITHR